MIANQDIRQARKTPQELMDFDDDPYEPGQLFHGYVIGHEEWQTFQKEIQHLEQEHLQIRVALHDTEMARRTDPGNEDLQARLEYLKQRLEELEQQAPWLASGLPIEYALWGMPFSCPSS